MKRQPSKAQFYRQFFSHCMIRDCMNLVQEVHHIVPFNKGGKDEFVNFICLCHSHHRCYRRHSQWREQQEELLNHKLYTEIELFGFTSDIPEEQFRQKIALWRIDIGLSCLTSKSPGNALREAKKIDIIHKYGVLIQPTREYRPHKCRKPNIKIKMRERRKWYCHWCGQQIKGIIAKRKYHPECLDEYRSWRSLVTLLYQIILTREIYYTPNRFRNLRYYLQSHNCKFQILGGLYGVRLEENNFIFSLPVANYNLVYASRYAHFIERTP